MISQPERPEIWAGIECTINRVQSEFIDQLALTGHYQREDDIDAISKLGIKTFRYPILWEKHQPEKDTIIDFSWAARSLNQMRDLNINPIIGLVHHGSGPAFTNLLDTTFPELLAQYARKVATEFPWVTMYTPVNEPLTTARFSGLYGLWYPHSKNDACFARMLLNQLKGTVLSMLEIRKINPHAVLVQTEDLGKTYSTPLLRYQARCENHRRFLTYDILCGRLTENHRLWKYFLRCNIAPSELEYFIENPCPPDLIGVNYYVTSERYLDEDMSQYPKNAHGGNTIHNYADVEAARILIKKPHGFKVLVRELWKRYNIPLAVTEAHLHCSREEQMKWFREIYESSCRLKKEGVDLKAVTLWSILGAYGWNKLLTTRDGDYERGAFDVSSGLRRPTAMVQMIKSLVETGAYKNTILQHQGWWKSDSRFFSCKDKYTSKLLVSTGRPLLIIGKTGTLGIAFSKICQLRALNYILIGREEADISNYETIESVIQKYDPWAIINAAGYVKVDAAETDSENCFLQNTIGPVLLANACKKCNIRLVTFSTDLVFDGQKNTPYVESDPANPLNIYGKSKSIAESQVLEILPESLIIRSSAFFGPWDKYNFVYHVLQSLENGMAILASDAQQISPTYVPHLANATLDLLIDGESGIWHLANSGETTWFEFARKVAEMSGFDPSLISASKNTGFAAMPVYSVLASEKGCLMPTLDEAIERYFDEVLKLV